MNAHTQSDRQAGRADSALMLKSHLVMIGASRGLSSGLTLARIGVGRFTLIDSQHVEVENIGQTLYDQSHIGMPKVEAAKAMIMARAPTAHVETYHANAEDVPDLTAILASADVVKIGIDHPRSMFALAKRAQYAGVATFIHGMTGDGLQHFTAFVEPGGKSLQEILPEAWKGVEAGYEPPAFFPSCALHTETMNSAVALMIAGYLHHRAGSSIELLSNIGAGLIDAGLATGFNGFHTPSGFLTPIYFGSPN
ncbi:ThiF family adenylyltransferase [Rhizobium leguminosarum]|uniref:ThiF family adenylyltransferase n=1 Tax=Rhizobium beringeri TaxID=3019934 RepID=A0ABY1XHF1_9HYPH|nr:MULTISPECIES: ThiF family adenylyltransferase [Rhizobium]TBC53781.1 ThiF family adenylyltransferase [Rhizobium leguminosarum]TBE57590.1 ThiF family adenylyltransferase [Rhizobium beringeri]